MSDDGVKNRMLNDNANVERRSDTYQGGPIGCPVDPPNNMMGNNPPPGVNVRLTRSLPQKSKIEIIFNYLGGQIYKIVEEIYLDNEGNMFCNNSIAEKISTENERALREGLILKDQTTQSPTFNYAGLINQGKVSADNVKFHEHAVAKLLST